MSIFEMLMLVCFGAAWPFSIYKSFVAKNNSGKSVVFLWVVLLGYVCGIAHKLVFNYDIVIYFYYINALMVLTDIALYYRNTFLVKTNPIAN